MSLAADLLDAINETVSLGAHKPCMFTVDYYAITPRGTWGRFQRTSGLTHLRGNAMSETAIYFYLRKLHPLCDIQIQSLEFK